LSSCVWFLVQYGHCPNDNQEQHHENAECNRPVEPGILNTPFTSFHFNLSLALILDAIAFSQTKLDFTLRTKCILIQHLAGNFQFMSVRTIDVKQFRGSIDHGVCNIGHRWRPWVVHRNIDLWFDSHLFFDGKLFLDRSLILYRWFDKLRSRLSQRAGYQEYLTAHGTLALLANVGFVPLKNMTLWALKLKYHGSFLPVQVQVPQACW